MALQNKILDQLDAVLTKHRELRAHSQYEDCSDRPEMAITTVNALMCNAIKRFAPPNSQYIESMKSLLQRSPVSGSWLSPTWLGFLAPCVLLTLKVTWIRSLSWYMLTFLVISSRWLSIFCPKATKIRPQLSSEAYWKSIYANCASGTRYQ